MSLRAERRNLRPAMRGLRRPFHSLAMTYHLLFYHYRSVRHLGALVPHPKCGMPHSPKFPSTDNALGWGGFRGRQSYARPVEFTANQASRHLATGATKAVIDPTDIRLDDVVRMRKPHPCGGTDWRVVRLGTDIGVRCLTCGRKVLMPRSQFAKRVKTIVQRGREGRRTKDE